MNVLILTNKRTDYNCKWQEKKVTLDDLKEPAELIQEQVQIL